MTPSGREQGERDGAVNADVMVSLRKRGDQTTKLCSLLGALYVLAGLPFIIRYGPEAPMMTFIYCGYVVLVLAPLVHAYLGMRVRRDVARAEQDPSADGHLRRLGCLKLCTDPVVMAPLYLGLLYSGPLLLTARWWPQLRWEIDTAGLGPFVWLVGSTYLLYGLVWRRYLKGRADLGQPPGGNQPVPPLR